jgi:hypothetical protein
LRARHHGKINKSGGQISKHHASKASGTFAARPLRKPVDLRGGLSGETGFSANANYFLHFFEIFLLEKKDGTADTERS